MVSAGIIFKHFIQKPEVGLLVNYSKLQAGEKSLFCAGRVKDGIAPIDFSADLGTASIQISKELEKHFPKAQSQIKIIFGNLKSVDNIQNRAKGPVSIEPKILRGVKSGDVNSYESAKAYVDYLFNDLNARRIYAYVEDYNLSSQKLCKKLGMRQEGLFKEFISFVNNPDGSPCYENTMQFAILKKEWNGAN